MKNSVVRLVSTKQGVAKTRGMNKLLARLRSQFGSAGGVSKGPWISLWVNVKNPRNRRLSNVVNAAYEEVIDVVLDLYPDFVVIDSYSAKSILSPEVRRLYIRGVLAKLRNLDDTG